MPTILRQSTQIIVRVGSFVDSIDGATPETGITLGAADQAEALKAAGAATVDISGNTWAAITGADGWYNLTLTTTDTNTVGDLTIVVQDASVCLPVFARFFVVEEAVYDQLYASAAPGAATPTAVANVQTDVDDIQLRLPSALTTGTADSGTTTTMVDAALTQGDTDYWKGMWIRFTSGTISGQTRLITAFTPGSDTITFDPATTQAVGTNTYELLPNAAVDIEMISGDAPAAEAFETMLDGTGGNVLTLSQLRINATAVAGGAIDIDNTSGPAISARTASGDAVDIASTGGNGDGVSAAGNGSGHGMNIVGGATGNGITSLGGATSGDGIHAEAATSGAGIEALGGATSGDGITATAQGSGSGINAAGGTTSGHGFAATGNAAASSHGILAVAGTSGHGISGVAGGSGNGGIRGSANTNAAGIQAVGQGTGAGFEATGGATGNGILATGGATSGHGISTTGTGGGAGIITAGQGAGSGITSTGGATGHGVLARGGATSGDGINAVAQTLGDGIEAVGAGGGFDINADIQGSVSGSVGSVTGSVGSVAAGGITAASIATDAIDADALATDAVNEIVDQVWDELIAGHLGAGSTGAALNGATAPSAATVADAVWDEARAGHVAAGSFGEGVASVQGNVTGSVASVSGNVGGNVTGSVGSVAAGGISAASFAAGAITATVIATNAIDADALATDAVNEIVDQVWEETLADHSGTVGSTAEALDAAASGGAGLTQQQVRDAMKLAPTAGAPAAGSVDEHLDDILADTNVIEPLVSTNLDATISSRASAAALATVQADTDDIQTRLPATLVGGRMRSHVEAMDAGVITAAVIATDAVDADAIAANAVTEIQAGLATSAALATVQADTDDIQTRLPAALVGGRMDSSVGAMAANVITSAATDATFIAEINTEVDTALADIRLDELIQNAAAPADPTADSFIDLITSKDAGQTFDRSTDSLEAIADSGGGGPTAGQIADAVWEEAIADHSGTVGSTAEALAAAAVGGSAPTVAQIADGVWDEVLAGHLTPGSTGAALDDAASGGAGLTPQQVADALKLAPAAGAPAAGSVYSEFDVLMGPGFNPATDSLEEIRDEVDACCGTGGGGEVINIEGI